MKNFITFAAVLVIILPFFQNGYSQNCQNTSVGFTPINDLGTGYYRNFQGGLYPGGVNTISGVHENDGLNFAQQIVPLDTAGNYNPVTGKIVLLSVGMSNCNLEFQVFMNLVHSSNNINPKLVLINGAQGGQDIDIILDSNAAFWTIITQRLTSAGLSVKQVQAVWYKEAESGPTDTTFPNYASGLGNKFKTTMNIMKSNYKNLKLCYLASRIYAGYASSNLNPEPYAYYSGWSVKWMIEDQINGDANLVYKGAAAKSPWLAWGPYLWADGTTPRSDGLTWICPDDYVNDGTHPSAAGRLKVASMLLNFFSTDETTKPWFIKNLTLNLSVGIEGFLNPFSNSMNMRDTVNVFLRNSFSPYSVADSSKAVIDSLTLRGVLKFYTLSTGTYYIEVRHRNSIETWSKPGGEPMISGGITSYEFTNSGAKAYGNNLVLVGTKYCIYSGDINQDGIIDFSDLSIADNDAANFLSGYISSDVNGDNNTDITDLTIVDNNAFNLISKITP
jgi:hypothetical protein